jgi:hypothetical protein
MAFHALVRDGSLEASSTTGRALVVFSTDYLLYLDGLGATAIR